MKKFRSFLTIHFSLFALCAILIGCLLNSCTDDDTPYYASDYGVYIEYNSDGTVSVNNPVNDGGVTITCEGHSVYVQSIADDVTYFLSGTTTEGLFKIVSSEHSQNVVLDGVSITNPNGGALNIQSKKKTYIVLKENTTNYLSDGGVEGNDDSKATLFAEGNLLFYGKGKLSVAGNRKHAICSDDYLEIHSGEIEITSAPSDGFHVHDYIAVFGGTIAITATGDGMDCDRGYIEIHDGEIDIVAGKKGIATTSELPEHDRHILITEGSIKIKSLSTVERDSTGYGLRSTGNLYIEGGTIVIDTKKKAISAGKSMSLGEGGEEDGEDEVFQPQELHIYGGDITCTGTVRPEKNIGSQYCLYYVQNDNISANSTFVLSDVATGERLLSQTSLFRAKKLFFSSPAIQEGGTYRIIRTPSLLYQFNEITETFTAYPPVDERE